MDGACVRTLTKLGVTALDASLSEPSPGATGGHGAEGHIHMLLLALLSRGAGKQQISV